MENDERAKLLNHIGNCREMLGLLRDETRRAAMRELIGYLETRLTEMSGPRDVDRIIGHS
jgi:hypothetical protein